MQSRSLEILVGFFVCLGVAAVLIMTFRVASLESIGSGGSYTISAKFDNVGSLKPGAPVKISGVRVGIVKAIKIDKQDFEANVTMQISNQFIDIPDDSVAKVLTAGLLGEQYIGLDPGGSETSLKQGSVIRLTQSALVLENLIGQFMVNLTQKSSASGDDAKPGGTSAAPSASKPAAAASVSKVKP